MTSPTRIPAPTRALPTGRQTGRNGLVSAMALAQDVLSGAGRPATVRNINVRTAV